MYYYYYYYYYYNECYLLISFTRVIYQCPIATAFALWAYGLNNPNMTDDVKMVKNDRWKDDIESRQDLHNYVQTNLWRTEILDFVKQKYPV